VIKNVHTAQHYVWGGKCDGWRLLDRPGFSAIQERIPPGAGETRHYHRRARQLFFVLSGTLEVEVGDRLFRLQPHDSIEVEPGAMHRVANPCDEDVEFLLISVPSTRDDRTEATA
jgi:mannose-6-phosphate isomerase-like protein (cupin superfamily)